MNEFDPLFRFFVENREIKQQLELIQRLILFVTAMMFIGQFALMSCHYLAFRILEDRLNKLYKKDTK